MEQATLGRRYPGVWVPDRCPRSGEEFIARETALASLATATETEVVAYQIPAGSYGVLEWLGQGGPATAFASTVVWKLRRGFNGQAAIGGCNDWHTLPLGRMNWPELFPFRVILQPGERVAVRCRNDSGAAIVGLQALLKGFIFPAGLTQNGDIMEPVPQVARDVDTRKFSVYPGRRYVTGRNLARWAIPFDPTRRHRGEK